MSTEPMFTAAMYGSAEAAREAEVKWLRAENEALLEALDWCVAEINRESPSVVNARKVMDAARAARGPS